MGSGERLRSIASPASPDRTPVHRDAGARADPGFRPEALTDELLGAVVVELCTGRRLALAAGHGGYAASGLRQPPMCLTPAQPLQRAAMA